MNKYKFFIIAILFVFLRGSTLGHTQESAHFVLIEIRGTINPATADYLKTAINQAQKQQALGVIVELDTPGGLLTSVKEMAQEVEKSLVPVIVYVTPSSASATSAGALLMLSSHLAAMAPGTHIGAAKPVDQQGQDMGKTMAEKAVSDTAAFARGLAEIRGRDVGLAEEFVSKSKSLTASEALEKKIIDLVVPNREALVSSLKNRTIKLGAGPSQSQKKLSFNEAQISFLPMTRGQKLLHFLANPNIATLLMTLGSLLVYVEITNPGIGVAGFLGGICFLVAFMAFQLLPIQTGGLILLVIGFLCLAAEFFVTAHGVFGIAGVIGFVLGILWMFDPTQSGIRVSPYVWVPAAFILLTAVLLLSWFMVRSVKLAKIARTKIGGGGLLGLQGYLGIVESVDLGGKHGKLHVRGETWDFDLTPDSTSVAVGDPVTVLETQGLKLRVKKNQ